MRITVSEKVFKEKNLEVGEIYANKQYTKKMYKKLADLEDIEDELGVELSILFKAICNEYIYVKHNKIIKRFVMSFELKKDSNGWFFDFPIDFDFYIVHKDKVYESIYLKDYGKTWALTREELE